MTTELTAPEVVEYLRAGRAVELPHLSCTVDLRDENIYVKAVKA